MAALVPLGYRVCLVEANDVIYQKKDILETRSIALSPASLRILKQLGFSDVLCEHAAPIKTIHISEQGQFGRAYLHAEDALHPLGAVIDMRILTEALNARLNGSDISRPAYVTALDVVTGVATLKTNGGKKKVCARWIVAADGAHSCMRQLCQLHAEIKSYPEHALAANVTLSRSHQQIAYERFTPNGPLALLPLNGPHMALVWTHTPQMAETLKKMPEADFLSALQIAFGYRTGRFLAVGTRQTYPLQQVLMSKQVYADRVIFVGNAAHTLHPVAGQALNLGLRDIAMLVECMVKNGLTKATLIQYQLSRQSDQQTIIAATDALVNLFKNQWPGVGLARRMGLLVLDNSVFLKQIILRYAKGFGGVVPDLVCGLPLTFMKSE